MPETLADHWLGSVPGEGPGSSGGAALLTGLALVVPAHGGLVTGLRLGATSYGDPRRRLPWRPRHRVGHGGLAFQGLAQTAQCFVPADLTAAFAAHPTDPRHGNDGHHEGRHQPQQDLHVWRVSTNLAAMTEPTPRTVDRVRLVALRELPLDVSEVLDALGDEAAGGLVLFVGRVRDHDGGRGVSGLDYSAHPSAQERLVEVCRKVASDHEVHGVAAVHRVGTLSVGDLAVVVATTSAHRGTSFEASRALIDTLKAEVPIWKHQTFVDGTEEWVGSP